VVERQTVSESDLAASIRRFQNGDGLDLPDFLRRATPAAKEPHKTATATTHDEIELSSLMATGSPPDHSRLKRASERALTIVGGTVTTVLLAVLAVAVWRIFH
jgi:hypothetical protein